MNIHFFFEGKLSREETSSAFIASLLEQREDFRSYFFSHIGILEPREVGKFTVEQDDVDIRIDYPKFKTVVLVENKIKVAALQVNQLVRYYLTQIRKDGDKRIVFVLLVPNGGTGKSEINRLRKNDHFRTTDFVDTISWRTIAQFLDIIQPDDRDTEIICSGFDSILTLIERAAQERYPLVGGREILQEIAQRALTDLRQEFPGVRLQLWRSKDCFNIYTVGTNITVYVDLAFNVESKAPFPPIGLKDPENISVKLRTQFALSAKGKKNSHLRDEWNQITKSPCYEVPIGEIHKLEAKWFKREVPIAGTRDQIARQLLAMGVEVLRHFQERL